MMSKLPHRGVGGLVLAAEQDEVAGDVTGQHAEVEDAPEQRVVPVHAARTNECTKPARGIRAR